MREILAMVKKDLVLLARDRMAFFFTFGFPLIMAVFFGTLFSGSGGDSRELTVAVVDEDRSDGSRALIRQLDQGPELAVTPMSRDSAMEAVRLGRRVALIVLPRGFGEARKRMFYGPTPTIELGLDPSRKAEGGILQGVLMKYAGESFQELFSKPQNMRDQVRGNLAELDSAAGVPAPERTSIHRFLGELDRFLVDRGSDSTKAGTLGDSARSGGGWRPLAFKTVEIARTRRGPRNAYQVSFPQGVLWAILSCAYGFALSLVTERTRGTLVRLRMAPISRGRILLGKAIGCLLTILTVATVLLLIGAFVFHVQPASVPLLIAGLLSAAIGFVGIMMLISVISRSQRGVSGLGWAIMMIMSMTGGGMVPLFAMPTWMQTLGSASPVRWAILALEGAIWRDFTPAQMALPCGILLGIGVVGFAVGTKVFRWTEA